MKKIILLTICFCLIASTVFADINIDADSSIKIASENTIYGDLNIAEGGYFGDSGDNIIFAQIDEDTLSPETPTLPPTPTQDHWVYIRTYDKSGITKEDDIGMSKDGDVIDVRLADYELSELEKKEWLILKVSDLTEEDIYELKKPLWKDTGKVGKQGHPIYETEAYRESKIKYKNLSDLKKGVEAVKKTKTEFLLEKEAKTTLDFARYERKRRIYLASRQFRALSFWVDYALDYWVMPAYAFSTTTCADDATEDREQICTINWTSQDYDTMTLWEDAKNGDLVTDKQIRTAHLYDDDGDLDDSPTIDGSTTSTDYYLKISSPVAERHDGTEWNGAALDQNTYLQDTILNSDDHTVIEWLIITSGSNTYRAGIYSNKATTVRNCIIHDTDGDGIKHQSGSFYAYNNIIYNSGDEGIEVYAQYATITLRNNSVYNSADKGIQMSTSNGTETAINNLVIGTGSGDDCYDGAGNFQVFTTNGAGDATGNPVGLDNMTAADEWDTLTAGSEDLHLKSGATSIDAGTDNGTSSDDHTGYFQIDIDGRDRDSEGDTWDLGADEYVGAAGRTRRFF